MTKIVHVLFSSKLGGAEQVAINMVDCKIKPNT